MKKKISFFFTIVSLVQTITLCAQDYQGAFVLTSSGEKITGERAHATIGGVTLKKENGDKFHFKSNEVSAYRDGPDKKGITSATMERHPYKKNRPDKLGWMSVDLIGDEVKIAVMSSSGGGSVTTTSGGGYGYTGGGSSYFVYLVNEDGTTQKIKKKEIRAILKKHFSDCPQMVTEINRYSTNGGVYRNIGDFGKIQREHCID